MANDSFTQLPPANPATGDEIDMSAVTVAGNNVKRQRIVIASDSNVGGLAQVSPTTYELLVQEQGSRDLLAQILLELRAMRLALTSLACQGGMAEPCDFDPNGILGNQNSEMLQGS